MRFPLLLTLLCTVPAMAQLPELEFESRADLRLSLMGSEAVVQSVRERFDFTGDGIPELPMRYEDEQGDQVTFVAFDPTTREAAFTLNFEEIKTALDGQNPTRFLGFFPFYDEDNKVAVFRGAGQVGIIAVLVGKHGAAGSATLPADQALFLDIDDDGLAEAIVRNPNTRTVQIWGTGSTGTATEEEIEASLARLFQNYPNPFRETTTITYDVEEAAPVSVVVFDIVGRRVQTLVDAVQPAGPHRVVWDGRDASGLAAAPGTYFYQLRVGDMVSSRQALHVK